MINYGVEISSMTSKFYPKRLLIISTKQPTSETHVIPFSREKDSLNKIQNFIEEMREKEFDCSVDDRSEYIACVRLY